MALMNWVLIEQRRVDQGLSRCELARRSRVPETELRRYDAPNPDDSAVTVAQLVALATVLDLEPAALLRPEDNGQRLLDTLETYLRLGQRSTAPVTRMAGTNELDRAHHLDHPVPGTTNPAADVKTLLAALHTAGRPLDAITASHGLDWPTLRTLEASEHATHALRGTGLRLRTDSHGCMEIRAQRGVLSPLQRRQLRTPATDLDPHAAAILWHLHLHGPQRLDRIGAGYRDRVALLEQQQLVQRRGSHYALGPAVEETLALTALGADGRPER